MERKNTVLLTVIAIATLLVAVVGATFAYFTATTTPNGNQGNVSATTATVKGVKLVTNSELSKGNLDYPGGTMITATSVTVSKQDDTSKDTNNYNVSFDLKLKAVNGTDQELKWYLVKTDSEIQNEDLTKTTCTLNSDAATGAQNAQETHYYYTGCTAKNIMSKLGDGTLIGFGTIDGNTGTDAAADLSSEAKDQKDNDDNISEYFKGEASVKIGLTDQQLSTSGKTTAYYYLVVEFPNSSSSQNGEADINFGKTISVTFDTITNIEATAVPGE